MLPISKEGLEARFIDSVIGIYDSHTMLTVVNVDRSETNLNQVKKFWVISACSLFFQPKIKHF